MLQQSAGEPLTLEFLALAMLHRPYMRIIAHWSPSAQMLTL